VNPRVAIGSIRRAAGRILPKGLGTLAGANLVSQLIALVAMPVLTRLCSISDFGLLQIYVTVTMVAGLVACLRFEQAVLQPPELEMAGGLTVLSLLASLGTGVVMLGVVPALAWLLGTAGWHRISRLTLVVGAAVAVTGMTSAATQWLVRRGNFQAIARARLVQSICAATLQLAGGFAGFGGVGLIVGDAAGRLAGLVVLQRASGLARYLPRKRADVASLSRLGREYRRFVWIASPSALVNAVGGALPVLIIERGFGTAGLGVYSLLDRVMSVPTLFVGQPLSQTFSHQLREALYGAAGAARAAIRETVRVATILGVLPFLALAAAGPFLVTTVFGERWHLTGQLAQLLALPYGVAYVLWPVVPTLMILNRLRTQLVWDVARVLALLVVGWAVARGLFPLRGAIAIIAVLMSGFGVIHYGLCLSSVKRQTVP
jgi:O-antigen/teichoic acid export membrane protein